MATIKLKGHEIQQLLIRDSYDRRAVQYRNKIIETLRKIGVTENNVNIELIDSAFRSAPASAAWYLNGQHLYYSYKIARKYVENLYIVFKVIELEVNALLAGKKTMEEFMLEFVEEKDVEEKRKEARTFLGIDHDVIDMNIIDVKYKELAKKNHPDMPTGNTEMFKKINHAHKVLKRELQ